MDIFICVKEPNGLDRILNIRYIESIREYPDDGCSIRYSRGNGYETFSIENGYAALKEAIVCKAYDLSESVNIKGFACER